MGRIRRMIRGGLGMVSTVVSRNELFERPGERARTPAMPPRTADSSTAGGTPARQPAEAKERAVPKAAAEASVPVASLAMLKSWLGAGRGLRIVNHWATWCIPCVEEFDMLKSLCAQLPDGVPLEGLSWDLFDPRGDEDDIAEHVANFSAGHSLPWSTWLIGETVDPAEFFAAFEISNQTVPQTWLVDDAGAVLHRVEGVLTAEQLAELVAAVYNANDDFGDDTHE